MTKDNVFPNMQTYVALIRGALKMKKPQLMRHIFNEAREENMNFTAETIFEIVQQIGLSGHETYIPNILRLLPHRPDTARVKSFCISLVRKGAPQAALTVLYELIQTVRSPTIDADTYGAFLIIEMILSDTDAQTIIDVCDSLMSSRRNLYALHVAYYSAVQERSSCALPLIQAMIVMEIELRPHYFWPLIISISEHSGETGVMGLLKTMLNFEVSLDLETFVEYIFPHLDITDPVRMIRKLLNLGFTLAEVLEPAVVYMLTKGCLRKATKLVQTFYSIKVSGQIVMIPLVSCYMKICGKTADAINILKALKVEANMTCIDESNIKQYNDWAGQFIVQILAKRPSAFFSLMPILQLYRLSEMKISDAAADITADYFTKSNENLETADLKLIKLILNELRSAALALPIS